MKKRSYSQNCALALSLDVLGERWTLLLVRELLTGPKRYKDLVENLRGMGTNLLADRLKALVEQDLIYKDGVTYQLTDKGKATQPIVFELVRWGLEQNLTGEPEFLHVGQWDKVAIKAIFQSGATEQNDYSLLLNLNDTPLFFQILNGELIIDVEESESTDAEIITDTQTLVSIDSEATYKEKVKDGEIIINGERICALDFLTRLGIPTTD